MTSLEGCVFTNLRYLDASVTPLTNVQNLPKTLQHLDLSGCNTIQTLGRWQLVHLDVSDTQIPCIEIQKVCKLSEQTLKWISLAACSTMRTGWTVGIHLPSLESLTVSYTETKAYDLAMLAQSCKDSLRELSAFGCDVSRNIEEVFPNLESLYID